MHAMVAVMLSVPALSSIMLRSMLMLLMAGMVVVHIVFGMVVVHIVFGMRLHRRGCGALLEFLVLPEDRLMAQGRTKLSFSLCRHHGQDKAQAA
ncbi:hypothetical protein [Methylobacillus flagellatus]|uniref:Uncharacterized protein n=1 Tax=Methylobacillus flagellatus (strain ATCC 51484 / DSM 6875 / VKM B-1610 / KT) TaxID=265072 RepID=Q1H2E1_METFK|nr:hypothetical protein [Methylobacillus flagellatus]ABE49202.1 hypothetical protein Mfla_0934 [Methylobacillus flagellatus KT]ABE49346.1 hypothetical protein Mfla_1078 [Methylobacillus flagellatus KT]